MRSVLAAIVIIMLASVSAAQQSAANPPQALPGAHAHNDYYHKRPLWDALQRGFVSIEADVFLVDGKLLVGHYRHELTAQRTLESLYLQPLQKHIEASGGKVFRGGERLSLLVDFKTDGEAAYRALDELLQQYEGLVAPRENGKRKEGAVLVIVTGNRPIDLIEKDKNRRVAVDGRLADLDDDPPVDLIPLVSESWMSHFAWRGRGPMPEAERQRLGALVKQVHRDGRRLRFWATPDDPAVWEALQAAGVDLIGADDLDALQLFLTSANGDMRSSD